jgi:beta-lactamase class D
LFYDLQKNTYFAYDKKRVKTGFIPASTFKIFNSLVALETGAARDENEVLKWNGIPQKIPNG